MTDKITLELTLEELKTIDKYVELNEETKSVFDKIKDAYPQPKMTLENEGEYAVVSYNDTTYYRLMGELFYFYCWYKREGVSANHPDSTLVMVTDAETDRLLEGLYYNHIEVKKQREPEDNEWKSVALRFGEKLVSVGPRGYYDYSAEEWFKWAVNTYDTEKLLKKENIKKAHEPVERVSFVPKEIKELVKEGVEWCEEHPNTDPLDWVKPQTPEQVANGLKEAFREAVKQGVVSSPTKSKTLTDIIYQWWSDVFTTHNDWDMETSIENLVDQIELFLPKEQSAAGSQNAYVESAVEGFNDAIKQIKSKLRNKEDT